MQNLNQVSLKKVMFTVFIVDDGTNPGRLRFTETKVFFDAKNKGINWATDCCVIPNANDAHGPGIIINSGDYITTNFRRRYPVVLDLIDSRNDPDIIHFSKEYDFDIRHRPPWQPGSKQLYILENLYKTVLRSKKLIYLENTESLKLLNIGDFKNCKHFFGLASGWKSISILKDIGIDQFETVTIFDQCKRQLDFQKDLWNRPQLPDNLIIPPPVYGEFLLSDWLREYWPHWHEQKVEYVELDLLTAPTFPDHSLIWISNVFLYEPNIFEYGWKYCQDARNLLFKRNKLSIIIEN